MQLVAQRGLLAFPHRVIQPERMKEQNNPSRAQTRLGNEHERRLDH
jgi:hypothetical protein